MASYNRHRRILFAGVSVLLLLILPTLVLSSGFEEGFEDNNMDEYTGDISSYSTQSNIVLVGDYAAKGTLDAGDNQFVYRNLTQNYSSNYIHFSMYRSDDLGAMSIALYDRGTRITVAQLTFDENKIRIDDGGVMTKVADASPDAWHNISLFMNWTANEIEKIWVNGAVVAGNFSFRNPANYINRYSLEVYGTGTWSGYFDNILIGVPPTTPPSLNVNLTSPEEGSTFSTKTTNFTATYSANSLNLTNATYWIWDSTGLFNNTETEVISGDSNSTSKEIGGLSLGNYEWNVYACGENSSTVICDWSASNSTFSVGAELQSINYDNSTFETAYEYFNATFEILKGASINTAQLVYDGVNYSISDLSYPSSTTLKLTKGIDIPTNTNYFQNETNSFYFRFIYESDQVQETSSYNQRVGWINLQHCNATYTNTTLNFTYYDELSGSILNASRNDTTLKSTFNYWLGHGSTYKNSSFETSGNTTNNQYSFCIYPTDKTYYADMKTSYTATDYSTREYYLGNSSLTSSIRDIPLYLLLEDLSSKFFVEVNQDLESVDNAYVTISKYFTGEGIYKTVEIRKTDDLGEFVSYFDIDEDYRFVINKNGENIGTVRRTITCQEIPCELTLNLQEAATNMWSGYYDTFATDVTYILDYNDTSGIVTFDFTDNTGLAQYFRLLVTQTKYNESSAVICNNTLYTTSGTLTCNVSDYSGDFRANAYISKSPEIFVDYITFIRETIHDILGELGIFVSFILIITITLAGAWNPGVGVALVVLAVFGMWVLNFTAFSIVTVVLITGLGILLISKLKT